MRECLAGRPGRLAAFALGAALVAWGLFGDSYLTGGAGSVSSLIAVPTSGGLDEGEDEFEGGLTAGNGGGSKFLSKLAGEEHLRKHLDQARSEADHQVVQVALQRAGLYTDRAAHSVFANTLLVTAVDSAYFQVYLNWQCFASRFGLDWVVIAYDVDVYAKLKSSDRALPALCTKSGGAPAASGLGASCFEKQKLATILRIMQLTGLDIVFSEVDNVFRADPFVQGISLGSLILSHKYDYIFREQPEEHLDRKPALYRGQGDMGFFYLSGSRKPGQMQAFLSVVLAGMDSIQAANSVDAASEQNIFWKTLASLQQSRGQEHSMRSQGFSCASMCGQPGACLAAADVLEFCAMDPQMHFAGASSAVPRDVATYHVIAAGRDAKIDDLKRVRLWGAAASDVVCDLAMPGGTPEAVAIGAEQLEQPDNPEVDQEILAVAERRVGLYAEKQAKQAHKEFANVLLITAAHSEDLSLYRNWQCFASQLGLDWAVIVNDEQAYAQLEPDRALPVLRPEVSGGAEANLMGRRKVRMLLRIMELTGFDLVFSDADNVFYSDPFAKGVSLGDLIRSQSFDYIYQEELPQKPDAGHLPVGDRGNTGFFFVASRKAQTMQAFFANLMQRLEKLPAGSQDSTSSDQAVYWGMVNELRNSGGKPHSLMGFKCVAMCGQLQICRATLEETLEYCAMDPFMHSAGLGTTSPSKAVTYHAHDATIAATVNKLKKMQLWGAWDATARVCTSDQQPKPSGAEASAQKKSTPEEEQMLRVAQRHVGLYVDKAAHPEFAKVLLLTSANYAYFSIYRNWQCFASKLGLDWAVIANDDEAYSKLEPDRAMMVLGQKNSGMVGWGSAKLDSIGRNKYVMVLRIMALAGFDVLFSDADNVFHRDPFAPGVSLGDLIRSQKYDYLYQEELQKRPNPGHVAPGDGGNTGFFFAAASRKPHGIQAFLAAVLAKVDEIQASNQNHMGADQAIFWMVFNEFRQSHGQKDGPWGFKCAVMCGQAPTCSASAEQTLSYCAMDAIMHPTGWEDASPAEFVTYHANYAAGEAKVSKLRKMHLWGAWDAKKEQCKVHH